VNIAHENYAHVAKVALVADTHGVLVSGLVAQLSGAELIVHAGDVGNATVLDALAAVAPVLAVAGNNDRPDQWPLTDHARLHELPEAIEIVFAGGVLVVVHGHQWPQAGSRHQRLRQQWPDVKGIVYGHSHRRIVDEATRPLVVNPGAGGRARAYAGAGWIGLVVSAGGWRLTVNGFT
jgi:putative phosphoesterase